ncbi:MAG: hypothetical protein ACM34J_05295 [Ignavibacteria bacterium]
MFNNGINLVKSSEKYKEDLMGVVEIGVVVYLGILILLAMKSSRKAARQLNKLSKN